MHVLDGSDDRELTTRGDVKSPTWSPDGSRFAYVASGSGDGVSVWVQDAEPGAPADEFADGRLGGSTGVGLPLRSVSPAAPRR